MKVKFLAPAVKELLDAIDYYNAQETGLGLEFANEIKRTLGRIKQYPYAWLPLSKRTRRCLTNRFPYGVIYQIKDNTIIIVAIMHLKRHPQSWRLRIRD